jgi:hypothetical protein
MSKIDFNKKTKLDIRKDGQSEKLNIITHAESASKNKSFRFRLIDLQRIKLILDKTNDSSKNTIFKETDIIRGLLVLGEEASGEKIISSIRKSI